MFKCAKAIAVILAVGLAACAIFGGGALAQKGGKARPRVISFYEVKGWTTRVIGTMDASGGNRSDVLVDHSIVQFSARWSSDGLWLGGYVRPVDPDQTDYAIFRIRPDGTDEREVVRYADVDLYNRALGRKSVIDVFGPDAAGVAEACWGPAGTMFFVAPVVYTITLQTGETVDRIGDRIFGVDVETGDVFQVTNEPTGYDDAWPHYSPALGKIVFVSDRTRKQELFVVNPDGSGLQQLTNFNDGLNIWNAVWNRAGTALAVSRAQSSPGDGNSDVWILHVGEDANNPGTLLVTESFVLRGDPNENEKAAAWSPDDSRLLISRSSHQIVSINMTDRNYPETILVNARVRDGTAIAAGDWNPVAPSP